MLEFISCFIESGTAMAVPAVPVPTALDIATRKGKILF